MDAKTAALIDYARPMINMENLMREAHELCLAKKYEQAIDKVLLLGAEAKVLRHILTIMSDENR